MKSLLVMILVMHGLAGFSQKKDSSTLKSSGPTLRIVAEPNSAIGYFTIRITRDSMKVSWGDDILMIRDTSQLDAYLLKHRPSIDKEKIAVEYAINVPFQTIHPVFNLLQKHGIRKWKLVPLK